MGGTSTDVATCVGGEPSITRETSVGEFPVRAPTVEVESIGAGGGSIAYVAEVTGALRVGPRSAGRRPGARVLRAGRHRGHRHRRQPRAGAPPAAAVRRAPWSSTSRPRHAAVGRLAKALGLDPRATAAGIVDIVTENMLGALRVVTVQKGLTPSDFALVSFGGAGGLHANALAALLGCFPVLVPPEPGVLSALGFVAAEVKNEFSQTFIRDADATRPRRWASGCGELAARGDALARRRAGRGRGPRRPTTSSTCATGARDSRSRSRCRPTELGSSPWTSSWSASTRSITACTGSGWRAARSSSTCGRSPAAASRRRRSRRHDRGRRADPAAARSGGQTRVIGAMGARSPTYERVPARPRACGSRATRSSSSTTRPRDPARATWPRSIRYLNLLISPERSGMSR